MGMYLTSKICNEKLASKASKKVHEHLVKSVFDVIILFHLQKQGLNGYDLMKTIRKTYSVSLSSGTVYSALATMKQKDLIALNSVDNAKIYHITDKGKETLNQIRRSNVLNSLLL
jgi:DNA-binding PadR family transcriptional regulator